MILPILIIILMAGGILAWICGNRSPLASRIISLFTVIIDLVLILVLWLSKSLGVPGGEFLSMEFFSQWIPHFGISFHMAADSLSLIMAALTAFIGILAVGGSWTDIRERIGFFYFNILWNLAGIMGVFLSVDLFLFYFFWEVMLIPMYFLISIWGHENKRYASIKFFIFTQAGGLLMLVSIIGLYLINGSNTGIYSFDYSNLIGTSLTQTESRWITAGFLAAFLVKLPAFPLHSWLPDAHTEAPTAGSVILAGLLLKTGAYGLLRFVLPVFPKASVDFRYIAMILGVIGILYGAKLAFSQNDLKRLVAYTSISHMGFVLLGIFAMNELALQGAVLQIVCHAVSTGALFILAGAIQERLHTRDLDSMGGLWEKIPRMGGVALFFVIASLGLPGLGNFVAEFLILSGSYQVNVWITAAASLGFIVSVIYSLRIIQKVFHGPVRHDISISDLSWREITMSFIMILIILWLGLYPQPLINTARSSLERIVRPVSVRLND